MSEEYYGYENTRNYGYDDEYEEWRTLEKQNDALMEGYRDDVGFDEMDPWAAESYLYL